MGVSKLFHHFFFQKSFITIGITTYYYYYYYIMTFLFLLLLFLNMFCENFVINEFIYIYMSVASAKSRSARVASHQPVFMGSCLAISHMCLPCLPTGRINPTCVLCLLSTSLPSHLSHLATSLPSHLTHLPTSPLSHRQIKHSKITTLSLLPLPTFF